MTVKFNTGPRGIIRPVRPAVAFVVPEHEAGVHEGGEVRTHRGEYNVPFPLGAHRSDVNHVEGGGTVCLELIK